jgi:tetratricopeptide (TPR) repeat protein
METPDEEIQQRTKALVKQGFEHLQAREFQDAIDVARQLEELRFSAAFELASLAHQGMGNRDEAVRALQRGVDVAPEVWLNWQLLGNSFSDLDRFEEAGAAYEKALQCDQVWTDSVRLNQAVLASRQERFDEALELLGQVVDVQLRFHATEHRINILRRLDRTDEAAAMAEAILEEEHGKEGDVESLARTAAALGRIHLEQGRDRTRLRERILKWMEQYRRDCAPLMAVLRDVDGLWSDKARSFKLTVNVSFPEDHLLRGESAGFYVVCDVVADDVDEALYFVRRLEADDLGETFEIDQHRESDVDPQLLKGVYRRSGRVFYGDED